jgi:hypothetical protein
MKPMAGYYKGVESGRLAVPGRVAALLAVCSGALLLSPPGEASAKRGGQPVFEFAATARVQGDLLMFLDVTTARRYPSSVGIDFTRDRGWNDDDPTEVESLFAPRRARTDRRRIRADLGRRGGRIDLRFRRRETIKFECGRISRGFLVGTFRFEQQGEIEAFERRRVRATRVSYRSGSCMPFEASESESLMHRQGGGKPALFACTHRTFVYASRQRGTAFVSADVIRPATRKMIGLHSVFGAFEQQPDVFRFTRNLKRATLQPPPPFTGAAEYASGELRGELKFDAVGRLGNKLTASSAMLVREYDPPPRDFRCVPPPRRIPEPIRAARAARLDAALGSAVPSE